MKTKAGHMNIKAVKSVQKRKEVELLPMANGALGDGDDHHF
jgi:hypothetical protein